MSGEAAETPAISLKLEIRLTAADLAAMPREGLQAFLTGLQCVAMAQTVLYGAQAKVDALIKEVKERAAAVDSALEKSRQLREEVAAREGLSPPREEN